MNWKGPGSWSKGKTYEELYGKEKALELKERLSETHRGIHFSSATEFKKGRVPWNKKVS